MSHKSTLPLCGPHHIMTIESICRDLRKWVDRINKPGDIRVNEEMLACKLRALDDRHAPCVDIHATDQFFCPKCRPTYGNCPPTFDALRTFVMKNQCYEYTNAAIETNMRTVFSYCVKCRDLIYVHAPGAYVYSFRWLTTSLPC